MGFSPDGKTLASGSWDNTIRLWDAETGRERSLLTGHTDDVSSVSFSPDGKTLASGSKDNTIRLWDAETGREKSLLTGHTSYVSSVSFSPDGKTLASGSWDNTIRLWDAETGREKSLLTGHTNDVSSVSFSPDGKTLASGSSDKTIRLWDAETGREKSLLTGYTDFVLNVSFSPDGKTLASGSSDSTIRLWDLSFLYDSRPMEEKLRDAGQDYNLRLVNLELRPIPPERNLYCVRPRPPKWPETHPFYWLRKAESGDADALLQLGIIHNRDGSYEQAKAWYQKAADKGNAEAQERLRSLPKQQALHLLKYVDDYLKHKEYDRIIEVCTDIIKLDPNLYNAYRYRGLSYGMMNQLEQAEADYRKAVQLFPDSEIALGDLGWVLIRQGRFEEAQEVTKKAHELDSDSFAWTVNLGHTYFLQGDSETARKYYEKTVSIISNEEDFRPELEADFRLFIGKGWKVEESKAMLKWMEDEFRKKKSSKHD
ncbi:tetratricopeptide repeat protein [Desulfobacterales bacterium HSG2]|nr:tetratricopeptide repeat protein [Desulfobacterales bacterium HSG2]